MLRVSVNFPRFGNPCISQRFASNATYSVSRRSSKSASSSPTPASSSLPPSSQSPSSSSVHSTGHGFNIQPNSRGAVFENGIPRIHVLGCGGAGSNAIASMLFSKTLSSSPRQASSLTQSADADSLFSTPGVVSLAVANTDAQALQQSPVLTRFQLGPTTTSGLGAGAQPSIGAEAAVESLDAVMDYLRDANMVFLAAGFGGGTGSGAAPVIARALREAGILTVAVVSTPFEFEGKQRMRIAQTALEQMEGVVDTLLVVPNQKLIQIANAQTTVKEAFRMADEVLVQGVRAISDVIARPGLINLDFADVKTVTQNAGRAMMGTGVASGSNRAQRAVEVALKNPLLADCPIRGGQGVLISIAGSEDLTLHEVDLIASRVKDEVGNDDANILFGSTLDPGLGDSVRVSLLITGLSSSTADRSESFSKPHRVFVSASPSSPSPSPMPPTTAATSAASVGSTVGGPAVHVRGVREETKAPSAAPQAPTVAAAKPFVVEQPETASWTLFKGWSSKSTASSEPVEKPKDKKGFFRKHW
ncbi:mitochondrial cell division protein FtsZ2 [Andalucia godoyi]|uniref:Mitochondrial FtsZ2 n=1 Tax=Andalucia godoyi TaxID=505711 RepID=A0A0E3T157_ANDGO|nr:mitochondrial FtsZ2 [Andalucia godoyi]KAF0852983.1 mitochondrial cell division protein FtsZ2 [Andalucia godoyi]|eukprot:AKB96258.1 mitochondrial cell division protein FtsZ2